MKQHGFKGKAPTLKDRGPVCEALWNANARMNAIHNEIEAIRSINKKDYWSHDELGELTDFLKRFKTKKATL